ncbi:MAG: DUF2461 domain-containing protein [Cytophagales bacterium]|nr:DUF2461 domain-containing protein [Cytophagales bacterium]
MSLQTTFAFLNEIKDNNNREWFNANKSTFQEAQTEVKTYVKQLEEAMLTHDTLETAKTKIFRIYKDVRFSKDKTPYKTSWNISFKRLGADLRGGYYLQLKPGNNYIAGGFFGPNPQDLLHIRKHISQDAEFLREAIAATSKNLGNMEGDQVKSAPKGFSKEDPNIDLLRYKQFLFRKSFTDKEVQSDQAAQLISDGFKAYRPFFDAMSEILTTDLNGISLLDR